MDAERRTALFFVTQSVGCASCMCDSGIQYVPHTHDVGLPTQFRSNVGAASQPIAGSMSIFHNAVPTPLQHWSSMSYFYTSVYSNHWMVNQCCVNIDQNTIHWPSCEIMLGHRLRCWANIISNQNPSSS